MVVKLYLLLITLWDGFAFSVGVKFSAESFSEISLLAKEGKVRFESLSEKASVPQYGPCWKNAISDLQIGCKFLSDNVQSDLALRFTDCFLQMSGHEPLVCEFPRSACLQKLSDRAFNAYTEFYTHTQSICYFLQSQVWHEETEKTIDRLSSTSMFVSQKLEEAEKTQEKLLEQQKESLFLQHDLIHNSKNVASELQSSQERINNIMKDFHSSTLEQKELLLELFDNLISLRSWAVSEFSWFSSIVFFIAATIIGFLFTSTPRTHRARICIFIIFTLNYLLEQFLCSKIMADTVFISNLTISRDLLQSWIWVCRKFSVCLSVMVILYIAFTYCDYNLLNYKLLLEIKNQNSKILNHINLQSNHEFNKSSYLNNLTNTSYDLNLRNRNIDYLYSNEQTRLSKTPDQPLNTSRLCHNIIPNRSYLAQDDVDFGDSTITENVLVTSEKLNSSQEIRVKYNLRSSKVKK